MRRTDTYSTEDPELAELLKTVQGVEVGKRKTHVVTYRTTRTSQVMFYPTETLASFAADLKYALDTDEVRGFNGVRVPAHHDFALAVLQWADYRKFTETPASQEALQQLAEYHRIPNYILPTGSVSPWFSARRGQAG